MSIVTVSLDMDVPASTIWLIWSDLQNSPEWDTDVVNCDIDGEFDVGTKGICDLKNGVQMAIVIEEINFGKGWSNSAKFLGMKLNFNHWLDITSSNTCKVTHQVDVSLVKFWPCRIILKYILKRSLNKSLINMRKIAYRKYQAM